MGCVVTDTSADNMLYVKFIIIVNQTLSLDALVMRLDNPICCGTHGSVVTDSGTWSSSCLRTSNLSA